MSDDELRASVLATLGMANASKEDQDAALYKLESIAQKRLGLALPELLTEDQLKEVESKEAAGEDDAAIMEWIQQQLPEYDEMIRAIIQDVASEVAG